MFWNTVSNRLRETLQLLMLSNEFNPFRLVGGTALSLRLGHRRSVDIDLFTDAQYGSVNFDEIESFLIQNFSYLDSSNNILPVGFGRSYFIGNSLTDIVKLDVYYTDTSAQAMEPDLEINVHL